MDSEKPGQTLDWATALAHVDGDRELLRELAAMFLEDYDRLLNEARNSILQRDPATLERAAHTLKGRLAFFGVRLAHAQVVELETMGRTQALAGAFRTLADIEAALASILPEFRQLSGQQSG